MTEHNIFEVKRRLRQLHSPVKAQEHLRALIAVAKPKSFWRAQLTALQAENTRAQLKRERRQERRVS